MDALLNILAAVFMLVAAYFLVHTLGPPETQREALIKNMYKAGSLVAFATACQFAVAAIRTWG